MILKDISVQKKKIKYVCEIGGGYGSLAQKIISNFNCKYVSIDLPEANFLTSYYLKNHFKNLKFIGNCELINNELDKITIKKNDIFILNPLNKISDIYLIKMSIYIFFPYLRNKAFKNFILFF